VDVTGQLPASDSGHTLALDFLAAGARSWRPLASTVVPATGEFRVSAALRVSGFVRVVDLTTDPASASAPAVGLAAPSSSTTPHVSVAAMLVVPVRHRTAPAGGAVAVQGRLRPAWGGRAVSLQGWTAGAWRTLATTRTGPAGGFALRFVPKPGSVSLRVRFAGDRSNSAVAARAGSASATYHAAVASWYYDAGSTACGFHAYYGVAHKSLPCGTRVTFVYGGRTVTATVDDRGPYISGRTWDLNQNTAAALGFQTVGVGTVLAAY
jgi:hypothetical protein